MTTKQSEKRLVSLETIGSALECCRKERCRTDGVSGMEYVHRAEAELQAIWSLRNTRASDDKGEASELRKEIMTRITTNDLEKQLCCGDDNERGCSRCSILGDNKRAFERTLSALPRQGAVSAPEKLVKELIYEIPKAKNALAMAAHPHPSPYKEDLERLEDELKQALGEKQ